MIRASRHRVRILVGSTVVIGALLLWGLHHVVSAVAFFHGHGSRFSVAYALSFVFLLWQVALYTLDRPVRSTDRQQRQLDKLRVAIPIPLFNEAPALLRRCLESALTQTRLPQVVYVVDDGSTAGDYQAERQWFFELADQVGVEAYWTRTANQGKRHAQGHVFEEMKGLVDVFVTMDSDGVLAHDALEELLQPLVDPAVQSVAGVVVSENSVKNLLTRIADLLFVTAQLVDRASMSVAGSVIVNSGPLAAYRADLVWENLDGYLNETFLGRKVSFSDDSLLTLYALMRGRTVQQSSAFVFAEMPQSVSHHLRQYVRWMRGSTIRSVWRLRYLPVTRYAYWMHLLRWYSLVMTTILFVIIFIYLPISTLRISPLLLAIPVLVAYGQGLRYLSWSRSDQSVRSQLITYSLAPVALLWSFFVLRSVRWYAMATCARTGWGTRQNGIEIDTADTVPLSDLLTAT